MDAPVITFDTHGLPLTAGLFDDTDGLFGCLALVRGAADPGFGTVVDEHMRQNRDQLVPWFPFKASEAFPFAKNSLVGEKVMINYKGTRPFTMCHGGVDDAAYNTSHGRAVYAERHADALLKRTSDPLLNGLIDKTVEALQREPSLNLCKEDKNTEIIWDPTAHAMNVHSSPHVDNFYSDAPGLVLGVSPDESTFFVFSRIDEEDGLKLILVHIPAGDMLMFTGELRYEWSHMALRDTEFATQDIPLTDADGAPVLFTAKARYVLQLRLGVTTPFWTQRFNTAFGAPEFSINSAKHGCFNCGREGLCFDAGMCRDAQLACGPHVPVQHPVDEPLETLPFSATGKLRPKSGTRSLQATRKDFALLNQSLLVINGPSLCTLDASSRELKSMISSEPQPLDDHLTQFWYETSSDAELLSGMIKSMPTRCRMWPASQVIAIPELSNGLFDLIALRNFELNSASSTPTPSEYELDNPRTHGYKTGVRAYALSLMNPEESDLTGYTDAKREVEIVNRFLMVMVSGKELDTALWRNWRGSGDFRLEVALHVNQRGNFPPAQVTDADVFVPTAVHLRTPTAEVTREITVHGLWLWWLHVDETIKHGQWLAWAQSLIGVISSKHATLDTAHWLMPTRGNFPQSESASHTEMLAHVVMICSLYGVTTTKSDSMGPVWKVVQPVWNMLRDVLQWTCVHMHPVMNKPMFVTMRLEAIAELVYALLIMQRETTAQLTTKDIVDLNMLAGLVQTAFALQANGTPVMFKDKQTLRRTTKNAKAHHAFTVLLVLNVAPELAILTANAVGGDPHATDQSLPTWPEFIKRRIPHASTEEQILTHAVETCPILMAAAPTGSTTGALAPTSAHSGLTGSDTGTDASSCSGDGSSATIQRSKGRAARKPLLDQQLVLLVPRTRNKPERLVPGQASGQRQPGTRKGNTKAQMSTQSFADFKQCLHNVTVELVQAQLSIDYTTNVFGTWIPPAAPQAAFEEWMKKAPVHDRSTCVGATLDGAVAGYDVPNATMLLRRAHKVCKRLEVNATMYYQRMLAPSLHLALSLYAASLFRKVMSLSDFLGEADVALLQKSTLMHTATLYSALEEHMPSVSPSLFRQLDVTLNSSTLLHLTKTAVIQQQWFDPMTLLKRFGKFPGKPMVHSYTELARKLEKFVKVQSSGNTMQLVRTGQAGIQDNADSKGNALQSPEEDKLGNAMDCTVDDGTGVSPAGEASPASPESTSVDGVEDAPIVQLVPKSASPSDAAQAQTLDVVAGPKHRAWWENGKSTLKPKCTILHVTLLYPWIKFLCNQGEFVPQDHFIRAWSTGVQRLVHGLLLTGDAYALPCMYQNVIDLVDPTIDGRLRASFAESDSHLSGLTTGQVRQRARQVLADIKKEFKGWNRKEKADAKKKGGHSIAKKTVAKKRKASGGKKNEGPEKKAKKKKKK